MILYALSLIGAATLVYLAGKLTLYYVGVMRGRLHAEKVLSALIADVKPSFNFQVPRRIDVVEFDDEGQLCTLDTETMMVTRETCAVRVNCNRGGNC